MLSFPNAKINLGLNIIEKRLDGFHNIETIFYPIGIKDGLEFVVNEDGKDTNLTVSGIKVDGEIQNNLVIKAYNVLRTDFDIPNLTIHLKKNIPFGAGIGGGSADAAFMLVMQNSYFKLGLSITELERYAAKIGSDCAFFVRNKPVFAQGKGEEMSNLTLLLNGYYIVLVKPDIHVSTVEAYASCKPMKPSISLLDVVKEPIEKWCDLMKNDFEEGIFNLHPQIRDIKAALYKKGAIYTSMSGSGSSVYGIFKTQIELKNHFPSCFVWQGKIE